MFCKSRSGIWQVIKIYFLSLFLPLEPQSPCNFHICIINYHSPSLWWGGGEKMADQKMEFQPLYTSSAPADNWSVFFISGSQLQIPSRESSVVQLTSVSIWLWLGNRADPVQRLNTLGEVVWVWEKSSEKESRNLGICPRGVFYNFQDDNFEGDGHLFKSISSWVFALESKFNFFIVTWPLQFAEFWQMEWKMMGGLL